MQTGTELQQNSLLAFADTTLAHADSLSDFGFAVVMAEYIADGLVSEDKRYWECIKKAGDIPTAAELLDFISDKFEVDIEGGI